MNNSKLPELVNLTKYNTSTKQIFYIDQVLFFGDLCNQLSIIQKYLDQSPNHRAFILVFDHYDYTPAGITPCDDESICTLINFCNASLNRVDIHFLTVVELKFNNIHPQIYYYYFPEFHAYYWELYKDDHLDFSKDITKKYVSLNKRGDPWRQILYKKFFNENIIKDGYFSFLCEENNGINLFHIPTWEDNKKFADEKYLEEYFPELASQPWPEQKFLEIENDEFFQIYKRTHYDECNVIAQEDPTWRTNCKLYEDTFVSIIIETSPTDIYVNVSEKIFRSIAIGHPFIVLGVNGTLQLLRDLGFDTFDDIFDTRYDNVKEPFHRITMFYKSLSAITSMTLAELNSLKKVLRPRLEANRTRFEQLYNEYLNIGDKHVINLIKLARNY